ncbi:MAG: SMC-Scp complex subunit ScpB [Planctomycetota bacterium]
MDDIESFESDDETLQDEAPEEGLSLDDLGDAYARAAAEHDPEHYAPPETAPSADQSDPEQEPVPDDVSAVHPEGIIEAALFVGHPENKPLTLAELAALMRDVSEDEVESMIAALNESYRESEQAFRISGDEVGYRLTIAPAVEGIRQSFLGKVREARLSQAAIEVLSLVAYQPGVTAQTVQDQRGRESGSLLNQLVRRRLLEIKREKPEGGSRKVPHYYPTERFLTLFHLESLEDLPQVDESFFAG